MATNLSTASGVVSANTVSLVTTVSGLTFQPRVVILTGTFATAAGTTSAHATFSIGFSDGTNQRTIAFSSGGGASTSSLSSDQRNDAAIDLSGFLGSVAMTSNGFTITFQSTPTTAFGINYIALAGSDLGNVIVGDSTMPTTAIAKSVTGLGFQPNFVMLISISGATWNVSPTGKGCLSYGCALSSTKRFAHTLAAANGASMTSTLHANSQQNSNKCLLGLTAGGLLEYAADLTTMDAGGFTITFSTAPGTAYQFAYLAIGGANLNWDMGTSAKPTTAIAQTVTTAFQPEIAWWGNSDLTTLNSITANCALAFSQSNGTTTESNYATQTNVVTTVCGSRNAAKAGQDGIPADTSVTATFTSFDATDWNITWDGTGAANQISWVALAGTTPVFKIPENLDRHRSGHVEPHYLVGF